MRNEIKNAKGPFVLMANHQSALDVVNIVTQCKENFNIVFGNNYYYSLPRIAQKFADACGVIHKQQFQTQPSNLKAMKNVIAQGKPLLIFPAGLMSEDGLSTPIPEATPSLMKWLGVDVYMAKSICTYFAMPKWSNKKRIGKTKVDIFKVLSSDELATQSESAINKVINDVLTFDAYEEQETCQFSFKHGDNAEGLENVVYQCPVCKRKYTIKSNGNRLFCSECGFTQTMDKMGFLHCENPDYEFRHVSTWTKWILAQREQEIQTDFFMTLPCKVSIMNGKKRGFRPSGEANVTLTGSSVILDGTLNEKHCHIEKDVLEFPSLPFVPGKCFEIQDNLISYRCFPDDPKVVMEWINTLKILHKQSYYKNKSCPS